MQSATSETDAPTFSRTLSPLNVWALAFGCVIGSGAFLMPGTDFLPKAGPLGTALALGAAALLLLVVVVNYRYMMLRHPLSGGEAAYAALAFGRRHGFFCAWMLSLAYVTMVPYNATALGVFFRNLLHGGTHAAPHYAVAGGEVCTLEVALALVAVFFFGWLGIRGTRATGMMETVLSLLLVESVAVLAVAALLSPSASAANLAPAFAPGGAEPFLPERAPLVGSLAIFAIAPWAFVGFNVVPQAAEEFSFHERKSGPVMAWAILLGLAVYVALTLLTAAVSPDWPSHLAAAKGQAGLAGMPTFHAAEKVLGGAGLVFAGAAAAAAVLTGICGFCLAGSRLLCAMGRTGDLPAWFGHVHPERGTPSNAILFIVVVAVVGPFFGREALGWILETSAVGAAFAYGYASAAAWRFARKDGNRFVAATGVFGVAFSVVFALLLLVPIPALGCHLSPQSYVILALWLACGAVLRLRRRRSVAI